MKTDRPLSFLFPTHPASRALLCVSLAHAGLMLWLGLTRHWGYLTNIHDLGVYDQAVWGILHGYPFLNTATAFPQPVSRLAVHFDPILALFAPLYAIVPAAEWLVVAQALAITLTAWPLYIVGVRVLQSEWAACFFVLAYLLNPFVVNAGAWDFQTVSLAAPLMACALLAIELKRTIPFLLCAMMLLLVREHYGLAVVGFGVLWWIRQRTLMPVAVAVVGGMLGLVLVLGVIMPSFSPTGSPVMMSSSLGQLSRYDWLGGSLSEVAKSLFFHPFDVLRAVLLGMGGGGYLILLLLPLGLFPLIGLEFLLPATADLAANLLSSNPMPRSVLAYHSIALVPLLVAAAMQGGARLAAWRHFSVVGLSAIVLWCSLLMSAWGAVWPLPGAANVNVWMPVAHPIKPEPVLAELKAMLPASLSLSAQANVASHFTQRGMIQVFPQGVGEVDCVVLRLASPTLRLKGDDPGDIGTLAHHLQMPSAAYLAEVERLVRGSTYGLQSWRAPWLILCKGQMWPEKDREDVLGYLKHLEHTWLDGQASSQKGGRA